MQLYINKFYIQWPYALNTLTICHKIKLPKQITCKKCWYRTNWRVQTCAKRAQMNSLSKDISVVKLSWRSDPNSRSRSLSFVRLPVCLSSVTFVHRTQAIEIFGNISTPFGTLAIRWHPGKILRRSSQGNPSVGGVKHKGVAEYSDFGPIERYISETLQDRI